MPHNPGGADGPWSGKSQEMNGSVIIAIELDFPGHTLLFYENTYAYSERLCHLFLRADAFNSNSLAFSRPYASAVKRLQGISVESEFFHFYLDSIEPPALFVKLMPE